MEPPRALEPTLNDIGTRYEHLKDHLYGLTVSIDILKGRYQTLATKERLNKLVFAAEVLQLTIDSFAGFNDQKVEYYLYKTLNSIPKNPEEIVGGRETPLI